MRRIYCDVCDSEMVGDVPYYSVNLRLEMPVRNKVGWDGSRIQLPGFNGPWINANAELNEVCGKCISRIHERMIQIQKNVHTLPEKKGEAITEPIPIIKGKEDGTP